MGGTIGHRPIVSKRSRVRGTHTHTQTPPHTHTYVAASSTARAHIVRATGEEPIPVIGGPQITSQQDAGGGRGGVPLRRSSVGLQTAGGSGTREAPAGGQGTGGMCCVVVVRGPSDALCACICVCGRC